MLEFLESIDHKLLLFINGWHNPFFDQLMVFISGKLEWIPLYANLLYLLIRQQSWSVWKTLITIVLLICITDQVSVKLFKEVFERYRPCHNADIQELIHLVNNKCGGKYGFVSSHAANSFGLAVFIGMILKRTYNYWIYILLFWAFTVAISRVYLGVHYPSDILGGAILGTSAALMVYYMWKRWMAQQ